MQIDGNHDGIDQMKACAGVLGWEGRRDSEGEIDFGRCGEVEGLAGHQARKVARERASKWARDWREMARDWNGWVCAIRAFARTKKRTALRRVKPTGGQSRTSTPHSPLPR